MVLKLAVRNVLRNRRRTALTVFLIGMGLAALMLTDGLVVGMRDVMIRSVTDTFLGQAQVHSLEFRKMREVDEVIHRWPEVKQVLDEDSLVKAYAPRVMAMGMLGSPANSAGIALYGIDPLLEKRVSKLESAVIRGDYLAPNDDSGVLLGSRLASILEVEVGDRVVLTAAQARTGELAQELFRVRGVFEFGSREMDRGMAVISIGKSQTLLNIPGQVHEVAFRFGDANVAMDRSLELWSRLKSTGNEALGWNELVPGLAGILEISAYSTLISGFILFALVSLGVINSMFMSIHERVFEFGVIRAIGTRPRQVVEMVLTEAGVIAMLGIAFGLVLGGAGNAWLAVRGIDFGGIEYAGAALNEPIRTVVRAAQFTWLPFFTFLLTILAGIYPAVHAARIAPAEAMRKSL